MIAINKKSHQNKCIFFSCLLALALFLNACGKKEDPEAQRRAQLIQTHAKQCLQNQNAHELAACLAILARRADQDDLCEVPKIINVQETCYAELARRNSNSELCKKIQQQALRDVCYEDAAQAKLEPADCQYINTDAQRDSCYMLLIHNRGEIDICAKIKNKDLAKYCNAALKNDFLAFPSPQKQDWNDLTSFFELFVKIQYPEHTSLVSFYNSQLKPAISLQIQQPLALPKLTLLPYYLLTPISQASFLHLMGLDGFTAENIRRLNSSLSFFDNSLLLMNLPNLLVRSSDGQLTKISQASQQMNKLAAYAAFETGRGFNITSSYVTDSIILVPHSLSQIATLVLTDQRWLTDVDTLGLCSALQSTNNTQFYQTILSAITQGISSESLTNLSPEEQSVLLQFVSAYLSNLHRTSALGRPELAQNANYDLLSITLLNYFFNSGGRVIINFSGRASVAQENCSYYAADLSGTQRERILLEELLTRYFKQQHARLFAELEQSFCKPCNNLFLALSKNSVEKPNIEYERFIARINQVFSAEATEINAFLQQNLERQ